MISSAYELEDAVRSCGMLPFFANGIDGFSVEQLVAPEMLFGDDGADGAWQWKGPVIRRRRVAYGKFFKRKAGFIALDLLPDFLNMRRAYRAAEDSDTARAILDTVGSLGGATSAQMRAAIFGEAPRRRSEADLVDTGVGTAGRVPRGILEPTLQKLQMSGQLLISDFFYKVSAAGVRYGWSEALYDTPESVFGSDIASCERSPKESLEMIVSRLSDTLGADPSAVRRLIV